MSSALKNCPPEVIELIVKDLKLDDIRNLRLSCRELCLKSSQSHFKRFFKSRHVDVTTDSLQAFAHGVEISRLMSSVENLSLVGVVNEPDDGREHMARSLAGQTEVQEQQTISLLSKAFSELAKHVENRTLPSLTLRIIVSRNGDEQVLPYELEGQYMSKKLWHCIVNTFEIAMKALAASDLRVESLNLFNDTDMQRCSLACEQLGNIDWKDPGLADSLTTLRSLSLSICGRISRFHEDEYESDEEWTRISEQSRVLLTEERNFDGLSKMFPLFQQLKSFELHYFKYASGLNNPQDRFRNERILQYVVALGTLPRLSNCCLRGISVREEDILALIKRTSVRNLALLNITLFGSFQTVANYCTSKTAKMQMLYFNAIYQRPAPGLADMIFFVGGHDSHLGFSPQHAGELQASEWVQREGERVRDHMICALPRHWAIGNPRTAQWLRQQRLEYGR